MGLTLKMENTYSHAPRSAMAAMAASAPTDAPGGSTHTGRPAARTSSEPPSGVHSRSSSLTNLARLPGVARAKLQNLTHSQFVRYIEDNDGQDKDENDIYRGAAAARQNVSGSWAGGGQWVVGWWVVGPHQMQVWVAMFRMLLAVGCGAMPSLLRPCSTECR